MYGKASNAVKITHKQLPSFKETYLSSELMCFLKFCYVSSQFLNCTLCTISSELQYFFLTGGKQIFYILMLISMLALTFVGHHDSTCTHTNTLKWVDINNLQINCELLYHLLFLNLKNNYNMCIKGAIQKETDSC